MPKIEFLPLTSKEFVQRRKELALEYSIDRGDARRVHETLFSSSNRGIDAYLIAHKTGLTAMECGRILDQFEREGIADSDDPKNTENDLARLFRLANDPRGAGNGRD